MAIFPTNRTVPLAKDLASSSTFTLAIGVSTPRTDLDTILAAIDQAIANEVTARQAATAPSGTALSNHISSTTAHAATAITVVASGNQSGTNAQSAINILQTQIDLKACSLIINSFLIRIFINSIFILKKQLYE